MAPAITQDQIDALDPDMADSNHTWANAQLTRGYEHIDHDLNTREVEKNPEAPPTPIYLFSLNRSYTLQLAQRMNYWFTDPAARLVGGRQRGPDHRSEAQKIVEAEAERKDWEAKIKGDIRCLWDHVGQDQGFTKQDRDEKVFEFFRVCRDKLEAIDEQGNGVGLAEFQMAVRETLEQAGLKLRIEGIVVMKEMGTEKRKAKNDDK